MSKNVSNSFLIILYIKKYFSVLKYFFGFISSYLKNSVSHNFIFFKTQGPLFKNGHLFLSFFENLNKLLRFFIKKY